MDCGYYIHAVIGILLLNTCPYVDVQRPCEDESEVHICRVFQQEKGLCLGPNASKCRKSCGMCGAEKECKDEANEFICGMVANDPGYCASQNVKCKQTCGLCGTHANKPSKMTLTPRNTSTTTVRRRDPILLKPPKRRGASNTRKQWPVMSAGPITDSGFGSGGFFNPAKHNTTASKENITTTKINNNILNTTKSTNMNETTQQMQAETNTSAGNLTTNFTKPWVINQTTGPGSTAMNGSDMTNKSNQTQWSVKNGTNVSPVDDTTGTKHSSSIHVNLSLPSTTINRFPNNATGRFNDSSVRITDTVSTGSTWNKSNATDTGSNETHVSNMSQVVPTPFSNVSSDKQVIHHGITQPNVPGTKDCSPIEPIYLPYENPPKGRHVLLQRTARTVTLQSCPSGSLLVGKATFTCMPDGTWNAPRPYCVDLSHDIALKRPPESMTNQEELFTTDGDFHRSYIIKTRLWRIYFKDEYAIESVYIAFGSKHCSVPKPLHIEVTTKNGAQTRTCGYFSTSKSNTSVCERIQHFKCLEPLRGKRLYILFEGNQALREIFVYGKKPRKECPPMQPIYIPPIRAITPDPSDARRTVTSCVPPYRHVGSWFTTKCLDGRNSTRDVSYCVDAGRNIASKGHVFLLNGQMRLSALNDGVFYQGDAATNTCLPPASSNVVTDLRSTFMIETVYINTLNCSAFLKHNVIVTVDNSAWHRAKTKVATCTHVSVNGPCGLIMAFQCPAGTQGRFVHISGLRPRQTMCEIFITGNKISKECPALEPIFADDSFRHKRRPKAPAGSIHHINSCPQSLTLFAFNPYTCLPNGLWDKQRPLCLDPRKNVAYLKPTRGIHTRPRDTHMIVDGRFSQDRSTTSRCLNIHGRKDRIEIDLEGLYTIGHVLVNTMNCTIGRKDLVILSRDNGRQFHCIMEKNRYHSCNSLASYKCNKGHRVRKLTLSFRTNTTLCEVVAFGDQVQQDCPPLNGNGLRVSTSARKAGTNVTILGCTMGKSVAGAKMLTCLDEGKWNFPVPRCIDMDGNLAFLKPTDVSSISGLSPLSDSAVDGKFDPKDGCASTHDHDRTPWWQVDLETEHDVTKVIISNRYDCCCGHLHNLKIIVYPDVEVPRNPSEPGAICAELKENIRCGETKELECKKNVQGRYVRIQKMGQKLTLCEVVVRGRRSRTLTRCPPLANLRLPKHLFNKDNMNELRLIKQGLSVRISCYWNHKLNGPNLLKCRNSKWSARKPRCIAGKESRHWCPLKEGYFYEERAKFCFKLETGTQNWYDSQNSCTTRPGEFLADLDTSLKKEAVYQAIQSHPSYRNTDYYVGGNGFVKPGQLAWMSGKLVNTTLKITRGPGHTFCLAVRAADGKWMRKSCGVKTLGRVCEKRLLNPGPKKCTDAMIPETCQRKAISGYCERAPGNKRRYRTMKKKCAKTCGFCGPHGKCVDTHKYDTCKSIKDDGSCQNPTMRQLCMKTCGMCPTPSVSSIMAEGCVDNLKPVGCKVHKLKGKCSVRHIQTKCKRTCGICNSTDGCDDAMKDRNCATVTKHGTTCKKYHETQCSKTCGCKYFTKCGLLTRDEKGVATSPLYPAHYPSNAFCYYNIGPLRHFRAPLNVLIEVFGLKKEDALTLSGHAHHVITNTKDEVFALSARSGLSVHFTSANHSSGPGFKISWKPGKPETFSQGHGYSKVFCSSNTMEIQYTGKTVNSYPDMTLEGSECKLERNQVFYVAQVKLNSCGIIREETESKEVIFSTAILDSNDTQFRRPISCRFPLSSKVSNSTGELIWKNGETINVFMKLFKDTTRITRYPCSINTTTDLLVEVTFSQPLNPSFFISNCYATANLHDPRKHAHFYVRDGCPAQGVVQKRKKNGFTLRLGRLSFITADTQIYIACDVITCAGPNCGECGNPMFFMRRSSSKTLMQGILNVEYTSATTTLATTTTTSTTTTTTTTTTSTTTAAPTTTTPLTTIITPTTTTTTTTSTTITTTAIPTTSMTAATTTTTAASSTTTTTPFQQEFDLVDTPITPGFIMDDQDNDEMTVRSTTPVQEWMNGDLKMPDFEPHVAQKDVSTPGLVVGVTVGVVMVTAMVVALTVIKYGPTLKLFRRASQPVTHALPPASTQEGK